MPPRPLPILLLALALPAPAADAEAHLSLLRQSVPAEAPFPSESFTRAALTWVVEPRQDAGLPVFQWSFTASAGAPEGRPVAVPGGTVRRKAGGFGAVGIRLLGGGGLRVGPALELRLASRHRGGSMGDTGESAQSLAAQAWASLLVQYRPLPGAGPILSLQAGAGTSSAGQPGREVALGAGWRF